MSGYDNVNPDGSYVQRADVPQHPRSSPIAPRVPVVRQSSSSVAVALQLLLILAALGGFMALAIYQAD